MPPEAPLTALPATENPVEQGPQQPDRATLELALSVGFTRMQRSWIRAAMHSVPPALGLSHAMAWPLVVIRQLGGAARQSVIAERMGLEQPSLVRVIDQLVATGLVTREPEAGDKRAKTVALTEAGEMWSLRCTAMATTFRAASLADISDAEIAQCLDVFTRIQQRLDANAAATCAGTTGAPPKAGAGKAGSRNGVSEKARQRRKTAP